MTCDKIISKYKKRKKKDALFLCQTLNELNILLGDELAMIIIFLFSKCYILMYIVITFIYVYIYIYTRLKTHVTGHTK